MARDRGERELTRAEIDTLCLTARRYVSRITVLGRRLEAEHAWTSERGSQLWAPAGDWLLSDGSSEWTVDAKVFEETYTAVGHGKYRKSVPVRAVQVDEDVVVPTMEGPASLCQGDWLLINPDGDTWPVEEREFARRYHLLDDEGTS